jgi:hypothetical protein
MARTRICAVDPRSVATTNPAIATFEPVPTYVLQDRFARGEDCPSGKRMGDCPDTEVWSPANPMANNRTVVVVFMAECLAETN